MYRSRKSIAAAAVAVAGVLAMAGVAAAAHGRSAPRSQLSDDTTTTAVLGGSGGTAGSGGTGAVGGSGDVGGSGGTGVVGGSGGSGVLGGTGGTGGTGVINEPGDDHGVDPVGHDANDDHGNDAVSHDANDDRGNDTVGHDANDDRRDDAAGHDANDDHGNDESTTSMSVPSTTLAPNTSGVQTFTVTGGNVTVDIENGVLTLVTATPNPGFTIDKSEARSDRIEVEFRGSDVQSRVRVRFEDGRLRVENGDH